MGHGHSRAQLPDDQRANLERARELWELLRGIDGLRIEDAMIHFLSIVHMGELLALSNRNANRVRDVLCCGVTDDATVMGLSSQLRRALAKTALRMQLCQNVGAFDGEMSRLSDEATKSGIERPLGRPFDCCAEHVVFEKLGRLGATANSTYAVQMEKPPSQPADLISSRQGFNVRVVARCDNCKASGGDSSRPTADRPFGSTPRLGAVVTDSDALVGRVIPVLTAPVMRSIRDILRGSDFNDASRAVVTRRFPSLRVFRTPFWEGEHRILAILGPDDELDEMYPNEHVHDEL